MTGDRASSDRSPMPTSKRKRRRMGVKNMPNDQKNIRQQEHDLFVSMAKVRYRNGRMMTLLPLLIGLSQTLTIHTCLSATTTSARDRWKNYTRYRRVLLNTPRHVIPPMKTANARPRNARRLMQHINCLVHSVVTTRRQSSPCLPKVLISMHRMSMDKRLLNML